MPDYNSYDSGPRRTRPSADVQPGISRSSAPRHSTASGGTSRPAAPVNRSYDGYARSGQPPQSSRQAPPPQRSQGGRTAPPPQRAQSGRQAPPPQRAQGGRTAPPPQRAQGGRSTPPPQGRGSQPDRRPPQRERYNPRRRKKPPIALFVGGALVVVLLIVGAVMLFSPRDEVVDVLPTAQPQGNLTNASIISGTPAPDTQLTPPDAQTEEEEEQDNAPVISKEDQVQLTPEQLHINSSLPSEWLNVLLLGTDERDLNEPARTDAMIIASINTTTGAVKLTSLLRDTAVDFYDLPKNSGTYRLNAANYFGGPLYAIKTVNELLNLNIQYYVSVNFYGFTRIAEALGGIDVDITEAEMNEINSKQYYQARIAATMGIDETDIENETLTTYGPNTHLNGRQTLAYARVRYVDSDFARTERQRTVIVKLTEKLRGKSLTEVIALLSSLAGNVNTNMNLDTVASIAYTVLSSGLDNMETLHLPRNDTYKLDRRNEQEMLYDTDWPKNQELLYNFIYT